MQPSELNPEQDQEMILEAVDEFIQDKRLWFHKLHKDHKDDIENKAVEKGSNFLPGTAKYIGKAVIPI